MKRKLWHFGMVTALFLLSLIPRIKNVQTGDYPTAIPHLQVLQAIQVWNETSPAQHAFLPVQTWNNPNDKFITYFPRLENAKGDNYYVSYPPFAFELAWGFCKLFGLPFSVLSITILNLLLQWIAAWCVFCLVKRLFPPLVDTYIYWPGVAAAAVFLCNPASMRIFSQVYFSESVGTALLCIFCYFAVAVSQQPNSLFYTVGAGISLFLMAYTEWVGFFAGLCMGAFWGIKASKQPPFRKLFVLAIIAVSGALLLFVYQLDIISGDGDFIANIQERYMARSGMRAKEKAMGDTVFKAGFAEWLLSTFRVTLYAARWFFPVLLILAVVVYRAKRKVLPSTPRLSKALVFVICSIVLLNFLALFNFSLIHSYTWAKWGLPLALCTAWCVHIVSQQKHLKFVALALVLGLFVVDLVFYQSFGRIDVASPYWQELTAYIKQEAKPDETIYITTLSEEVDPTFHLTYYTRRNMMNVQSQEEAKNHAAKLGRTKMVWFYFNQAEGKKEAYR